MSGHAIDLAITYGRTMLQAARDAEAYSAAFTFSLAPRPPSRKRGITSRAKSSIEALAYSPPYQGG